MDDKTKKDFIQLFNKGFEEVVLPVLDDLTDSVEGVKSKLGVVENRLGTIENRLDSVERRLDQVIDNQFGDTSKLADYGKRIKKLEAKAVVST